MRGIYHHKCLRDTRQIRIGFLLVIHQKSLFRSLFWICDWSGSFLYKRSSNIKLKTLLLTFSICGSTTDIRVSRFAQRLSKIFITSQELNTLWSKQIFMQIMNATDYARSRQKLDWVIVIIPFFHIHMFRYLQERGLLEPEDSSPMLNRKVGHTYRPTLCDIPEELTLTKICMLV
jgi:hypothetical protein